MLRAPNEEGWALGSVRRGAAIVLAAALVIAAASALATWVRVSNPTTGAAVPTSRQGILPDGIDVDVVPGATGALRTGDVVVAIEGLLLDTWARTLLDPEAPRLAAAVGDTIDVDIRRGTESLSLEVTLSRLPAIPIIASGIGTLSFVFLMLVVAVAVFALRPTVPAAGALLIAAVGGAGSTLPFLLSQDPIDLATGTYLLEYPLIGLIYVFLWAGLIDFVLVFPRPFEWLARRPAYRLIPYLGILGAQLGASILAAASSPTALAALGAISASSLVPTLAAFTILPITLAVRWRRGPREDRRLLRGFAFVIGGIIAADLVIWVLPEAVGRPPLLPWTVTGLTGLPFPFLIAAAIIRHQAFDFDVVVRRSLVYGGLTLVVRVTYVAAASFLGAERLLPRTAWSRGMAGVTVVASVAAIALPLLLVSGRMSFETETPLVVAAFEVQSLWLLLAGRRMRGVRGLAGRFARITQAVGASFIVGTAVAGAGFALPSGSPAQLVVMGVGGTIGVVGWIGWPVWFLAAGRTLRNGGR